MIDGDYEFWSRPDAMEIWQARCEAARAKAEATGKTAFDAACERIDALAPARIGDAIKRRARDYLRRPMGMNAVDARLPHASPRMMIAIADHHLDTEVRLHRRRWFGAGGEVPIVNAKAIRLAGRWRRRFERDDAMAVAAE